MGKGNSTVPDCERAMTEEPQRETDPRDTDEGPGGSKVAPEGNSNARFFVPPDQEERRERRDPDEPEDRAGAADGGTDA